MTIHGGECEFYFGWRGCTLFELIHRLAGRGLPHATVYLTAVENDGLISRGLLVRLLDRHGSLGGWTAPVKVEIKAMKVEGLLPETATCPLAAHYDHADVRTAVGAYRIAPRLVRLFWLEHQARQENHLGR